MEASASLIVSLALALLLFFGFLLWFLVRLGRLGRVMRRRFFFLQLHHFKGNRGRHVAMELDRHRHGAQRLDRLRELDLPAVDRETLVGQTLLDVLARDRKSVV